MKPSSRGGGRLRWRGGRRETEGGEREAARERVMDEVAGRVR